MLTLRPDLSDQARDALRVLTTPRQACGGPWSPHQPHPKQAAALCSTAREMLYGGAAGGGKSDMLVMGALQYVCVPGYSALLMRQTYPQLVGEDGLLPRCEEWLAPTAAKWEAQETHWVFPSGATLKLGHAEREVDRFKFGGHAYQYVGFDELTNWPTPKVYLYLSFARARRLSEEAARELPRCPTCGLSAADVPLRARSTTNPGGLGTDWVFRRFVQPWRMWRDGEGPRPERVYITAMLRDNPSLDAVTYLEGLGELDAVEQAQLAEGNWDVRHSAGMIDRTKFLTADSRAAIPAEAKWVRCWDMAATEETGANDPDWTAGALVAMHDGRWWIAHMVHGRYNAADAERVVVSTAEMDRRQLGLKNIRMEQEPGSSGKSTINTYRRLLAGYAFKGVRATGSKTERAKVLAAASHGGNVTLVDDGTWDVDEFLTEANAFPSKGVHDDQVDAVSGAMDELAFGRRARLLA